MKAYVLIGVGVAAFAVSAGALYLTGQPLPTGVLVGLNRIEPASVGTAPSSSGSQAALQADLQAQRGAYQELARTVARLERRIDLLTDALPNALPGDAGSSPGDLSALTGAVESAMVLGEPLPGSGESATAQLQGREQQRQRLVAAGFSPEETDEIIRVVDENTLQRLTLRYQAARGGDAARNYRAELRSLPRSADLVREQFGEGAYDQYLYATGRPNRVVVDGVLERSAAQQAGLRAGDTLVQFDDQPVYALGDLIRICARGGEFEEVPLRVLREGELIEVSVPRGPLGINASSESINPG